MKKLILCLAAALAFTFAMQAQESKKAVKTTTSKTVTNNAGKTTIQKKTKVQTEDNKAVTKTTVVLKKDGTPDKRYKSSKTLKNDGTPDMRYKVNKKKQTTTKK